MATSTATFPEERAGNRWIILSAGIIAMIAVANYQYGWTLFVPPLQKHLNVDQAVIQVTFTIFVLLETWLVPFEGWLVDKFGPRLLVMLGGILAGLGWVGSGKAETVTALYLSYAVAGIGAGIVYGTSVGTALKWFPDHRGLAAGLTAAGFGAGAAFTVSPIARIIATQGYQAAFIKWGIIQGVVIVLAALFLKSPPQEWLPKTWRTKGSELVKSRQIAVSFTSKEMASTPHFWLMYFMMALVATGGLMAVAQLSPMAISYGVAKIPVKFLWMTIPALTFALSADRLVNGFCRPMWGWVSDHIGRENTMGLAFGLEAIAKVGLIALAARPLAFVIMTAFTFFGWGEIFSLFPALCGDFFGRKHATENYGFLYTAKGTASVFIPIGSALAAGKAFDFRADILLLIGGAIMFFVVFLAPTVMKLDLSKATRSLLSTISIAIVVFALVLTVVRNLSTGLFHARWTVPNIGWSGVFGVSIVFDLVAAGLALFVLKRMKAPVKTSSEPQITAGATAPAA
ncbi:MAG TPA: oxalate/formate MFS antiporter [Verrucomicrobiae bacterium]|nr:oxalate/formate MFS antiporter [Verrucomicrobiae bacterium]